MTTIKMSRIRQRYDYVWTAGRLPGVRSCNALCSAHLPVTMTTTPLDAAACISPQPSRQMIGFSPSMSATNTSSCACGKLPVRKHTQCIYRRHMTVNYRQISPILNCMSADRKLSASITAAASITCVLIAVSRLHDMTSVRGKHVQCSVYDVTTSFLR